MPGMPIGFFALAQNDKRLSEIFDVRMSVGKIRAPDQLSRFSMQQWVKDAPSHCRIGAPGTKEIAAACCSYPNASLLVRSEGGPGYFSPDAALARVRSMGHVFGKRPAV